MSSLARAERRRRWREAVALARSRLARTTGGRVGRVMGWILLAVHGGAALAQRLTEAVPADLLGYAPSAARAAAWLAAGPIALAAANARERRDEVDGVASLASAFGVGRDALRGARLVATLAGCSLAIAVPAVGTGLVAATLQETPGDALEALRLLPALAVFAVVAGVVLGLAATVADRIKPDRGRSTLAAMVLVPWVVADALGWPGASIPGALDAVLTTSLSIIGLGRLG